MWLVEKLVSVDGPDNVDMTVSRQLLIDVAELTDDEIRFLFIHSFTHLNGSVG